MQWNNLYRGFLIGTCDLIPGVSGGTVAVILGIYDQLLASVGNLFSRHWRQSVNFLLPLGIGMASALLGLSRTIAWLLEHHYVPTQFFFIGLIIGMLPTLFVQAEARHRFLPVHVIVMIVAALLVASMALLNPQANAEAITALTFKSFVALFASGCLASMAMLLPGISGSFVLLLLGVYPTAIHALASVNLPLIAVIGSGVGVGFIVSSKAISHLLTHFRDVTYAAIIGLIIGSLFVVYPGQAVGVQLFHAGIACVAGFILATLFGHRNR